MEKSRYIVIEGPIGVGKTSLVNLLIEEFGGRTILEDVEGNPFLPGFYRDRDRYNDDEASGLLSRGCHSG